VRCVAQESDVDSCTAGKQWEPSRILRALGVPGSWGHPHAADRTKQRQKTKLGLAAEKTNGERT
jgi:hypothetical protein